MFLASFFLLINHVCQQFVDAIYSQEKLLIDPHGQPYKVIEKKDGAKVARFVIRDNCRMSNKEVLKALQERYGMFYDKITLRRSLSDNPKPLFSKKPYPVVGDSVEVDFAAAVKMKILSDKEIEKYQQQLMHDSLAWSNQLNNIPFYEFQLSRLGYFNCDRFNTVHPKINFTLLLNETERIQNLFSVLAFYKYRSVVPGYYYNNKLHFSNVPTGEKVHVISVGVKDGVIVSCIQPFTVTESENNLQFTETNPLQFSAQLRQLHLR